MPNLRDKIEHVVVLMLENRSFDHLLGYLNHPNNIDGLANNPQSNPSPVPPNTVFTSNDAIPVLHTDPGHHHADVLKQVYHNIANPYNNLSASNNKGFVNNFQEVIQHHHNSAAPQFSSAEIMKCFADDSPNTIIFNRLAKQYVLCDRWHCSVPGATWPNRQFIHAATSDGKVDNKIKLYRV